MLFPRTKFTSNSIYRQWWHLLSEVLEVGTAIIKARFTGDWNHVSDELVDCQQSSDTALHIVQEQHGADSYGAYTRVAAGCMRRGYYERKGLAAAPSIIRDLLAEVERLDAENLELNAGLAEFNVIHQALKDSAAQLKAAESLAASRLADQESIEKHTARVCAEICDKIADGYAGHASWAANEIRKRYGVES